MRDGCDELVASRDGPLQLRGPARHFRGAQIAKGRFAEGHRRMGGYRVIGHRMVIRQREGHPREHGRATASSGLDVQGAAHYGGAFSHADQADHRVRDRRGVESDAVVFDHQGQGATSSLENDANRLRMRMSRHVVQGLLSNAIQRRLDLWCHTLIAESFDVKPRPHMRVLGPLTDVVLEHRFQTEIVEGCRTQFPRQKVDIAIDLRQEGVCLGERHVYIGHVRRDGANRLKFQTERRQLLSKVVVEIPGDPAPLFLLRND